MKRKAADSPIVEAVRRAREAVVKKAGYDMGTLFAQLREVREQSRAKRGSPRRSRTANRYR
jgi:hypothetical protein